MRIVCISDTHTAHDQIIVPDGDLLIHAGDISGVGRPEEITRFNDWLGTLPHPHKVMIAGNHDLLFESEPTWARSLITHATYLEDSSIEIAGLKIWGSPITPWFMDWAFNRQRGEDIQKHWELIPTDIDILITHGPPYGILDQTFDGRSVGCQGLGEVITQIQPKLHVFGHIHEAYGQYQTAGTHYVNACIMDLRYRPIHLPVVLDW